MSSAPVYIGIAADSTGSGTSITVDISTINAGGAPNVGDFLIAIVGRNGSSHTANKIMRAVASDDGWQLASGASGGGGAVGYSSVFFKFREAGDDDTVEFMMPAPLPGSDDWIGAIMCWRGVDRVRPICQQSINYGTVDPHVAIAETTRVANTVAIAALIHDDNNAGKTPTPGWTPRLDADTGVDLSIYIQTQEFPTVETSTGTASVSNPSTAEEQIYRMIVLQPPQPPVTKDIRCKLIEIDTPAGTGNQDTTGIGFDVKAIIPFGAGSATQGSSVTDWTWFHGIGADDGFATAEQACMGAWHDSGASSQGWTGYGEAVKWYAAGNTTLGSPTGAAVFSSITDGLRLNWSATPGAGEKVYAFAWGGEDFRAEVVTGVLNSADTITALDWRPDFAHYISQGSSTTVDQIRSQGTFNIGWLDCQVGTQVNLSAHNQTGGNDPCIVTDVDAFAAMWASGTLFAQCQFQNTASDGIRWEGSGGDRGHYLFMNFGGGEDSPTNIPASLQTVWSDDSGVDGTDTTIPKFAGGLAKQVMHTLIGNTQNSDGDIADGGCGEGAWDGRTQTERTVIQRKQGSATDRYQDLNRSLRTSTTGGSFNVAANIVDADRGETLDWNGSPSVLIAFHIFTLGEPLLVPPGR